MRSVFLATAIGLPFLVGASVANDQDHDVVTTFKDPAIVESSGLVVADGLAVTVNDSGDSARIFTVDLTSGRTVGVTSWAGEAVDMEALAPAGAGRVWVGDTGDNYGRRESVTVTRVPYGRTTRSVAADSFELRYPAGHRDAEALVRHPRTRRLYVITKGVFGGEIYAAPTKLRPGRPNRLLKVGGAPGLVTDAAFFPDGKHLIVRDYSSATVLDFPSFKQVADFDLPAQQQGEGIAVSRDGKVYASSEGIRSELLRIRLPGAVRRVVLPSPTATPSPSASAAPGPGPADPDRSDDGSLSEVSAEDTTPDPWQWLLGGLLGLAAIVVLIRALRPR